MRPLMPAPPPPTVLLDELRTAVLVVDSLNRVRWANAAAEELLHASATRLEGMPLRRSAFGLRGLEAGLERVRQSGRSVTERRVEIGSGSSGQQRIDCDITPLELADGLVMIEMHRIEAFDVASRDAVGVEQNEAARLLLRGLAHEIKNPLGGLRGAAQLLEQEIDPAQRDYTQVIIDEADRLKALVDRMLAPERPLKLERFNVHELTERVAALLGSEAGDAVRFERDYDPSIPDLEGDRDRLLQVLLNLGRNAVVAATESKAADGAQVCLRTRVAHQQTIGLSRHRLAVRIEVEDNGPGVDEELVGRMFYPMVTGRSEGTGLGLSIAQALAMQHGGIVDYLRDGERTTFSLLLPVDEP